MNHGIFLYYKLHCNIHLNQFKILLITLPVKKQWSDLNSTQNWFLSLIFFPDPPRNTTVSVIPDEEGVATALICRSDANPPVHTYTWYKGPRCVTTPDIQQGTQSLDPPCGTGQILNITHISEAAATQYCCVANNGHGSQNFTVTVNTDTGRFLQNQRNSSLVPGVEHWNLIVHNILFVIIQ